MTVSVRKILVGAVVGAVVLTGAHAAGAEPPNDIPVTVDDNGATGAYSSLVLDADGFPVITYYEVVFNDLRLVHCDDPDCAGGDVPVTIDFNGSDGGYSSLVLDADGFPVISYFDATSGYLRVMHCDDPGCVGEGDSDAVTVDTGAASGGISSLVLDASGFPVVSYPDVNGDLRVLHCINAGCTGPGNVMVTIDDAGTVLHTSLVLDGAGFPVISYFSEIGAGGELRMVHCNDADCAGDDEVPVTAHADVNTGHYPFLVLDASGFPVISFHDHNDGDLQLLHCNDADCAGDDDVPVKVDEAGHTGSYSSLALDGSGFPVISHYDATNGDLRLVHCNDADCAGDDDVSVTVDAAGDTGSYPSLALDGSGFPVISYYDATNGSLRLVHCNDPYCTSDTTGPIATIILAPGQTATAGGGPIEFAVTFDEAVAGFDSTDVTVTGSSGATSATVTGSGAAFTVTVDSIPGDGSVTITIAAGAVTDTVGNVSQTSVNVANTVAIEAVVTEPAVGPRELTGMYAATTGIEGSVSRLYMAVFSRQPDARGHAYWVARAGNGLSLRAMADFFISSPEFDDTYSTLDNAAFVDLLYLNVMNRTGDAGGVRFWNEQLDGGMARSLVVLQFSESPEFRKLTGTT